jgi:V8-like Glu-specific endopeptidase
MLSGDKVNMTNSAASDPYDPVVYITDTIGDQSWQGSGVLISPDEVLTASHVVYTQGVGTASNIVVTPGYDAGSSPYGSANGTYIHYNPVEDANRSLTNMQSQDDYAVIHLSTPFTSIGYMNIAPNFAGGSVNVTGYPASARGAQVNSVQTVTLDPNFTILDGTSLGEGSSGGPLWIETAQGPAVVGLVSTEATNGTGYNTLITTAAFNQIEAWVAQDNAGTVVSHVPFDFNGGTTSNILFRDNATGDEGYLALGPGGSQGMWVGLGASSPAYSVVGVGDFNGDGTSDILFRNTATGDAGYLAMSRAGGQGTWHDVGQSSTAYAIVGDGDFMGNGVADPLFRDSANGDMGVFLLGANGTNTWQGLGAPSLLYSVVGVGDFTGTGRSDILFRNNATGDAGYYQVSSSGGQGSWVGIGTSSTAYTAAGVGDFNGDGTSDILFRDNANGDTGFFAMPKAGGQGVWHDLGVSSTAYTIASVGDYTGNGIADILFRNNATGDMGYTAPSASGGYGTWHVLGSASIAYAIVSSPTFG